MSRRMWARRMIRAGWLLAPVIAFPGRVLGYVFSTSERFFWCTALFLVVGGIGSCTTYTVRSHMDATAEQVSAALKDNACMIDLMPRRQAVDRKDQPLTIGDLEKGTADCEAAQDAHTKIMAQRAAMEAFTKKK